MYKGTVISLCDYTGIMVEPWVKAGYRAVLVDPQHGAQPDDRTLPVQKIGTTLQVAIPLLQEIIDSERVVMVFGFPPCDDMAVSGAKHFAAKRLKDPYFQEKAAKLAQLCAFVGNLAHCPYAVENPVSVLSTLWRKADYTFHPYEYGGYLPEDDVHPLYPGIIVPRDAYPKKTCVWAGNGFVMPPKRPVSPPAGYSQQFTRLGGKSLKTKNIRSATPRGFAQAVFEANAPEELSRAA